MTKRLTQHSEIDDPGAYGADWRERILTAAYFNSERRGFAPGRELEDWLEAERGLEHELRGQR